MKHIEKQLRKDGKTYSLLNCKDGYYLTVRGKKVSFLGKDFSKAQDLFLTIVLG